MRFEIVKDVRMRRFLSKGLVLLIVCLSFGLAASQVLTQAAPYVYAYAVQNSNWEVEIYTVDANGETTGLPLVTVPFGSMLFLIDAQLSPNGEWIALIPSSREGEAIQLVNVHTLELRTIPAKLSFLPVFPSMLSGPYQRVVWSPDSRYLAFLSIEADVRDVYLYSVVNDTIENFTNDEASESRIAWSPDSTRIVTLNEICENYITCYGFIDVWNLADHEREAQLELGGGGSALHDGFVCQLHFSPDQTWIFFAEFCDSSLFQSRQDMFLWKLTDQDAIQITNYTEIPEFTGMELVYGRYEPFWLNNDQLLIGAVYTNPSTDYELRTETILYDLPSGNTTVVMPGHMAHEWAVNPGSGELAIRTSEGSLDDHAEVRIGIFNEPAFETRLTFEGGCNLQWSPDGLSLAYAKRDTPLNCLHSVQSLILVDATSGEYREIVTEDESLIPVGWITQNL